MFIEGIILYVLLLSAQIWKRKSQKKNFFEIEYHKSCHDSSQVKVAGWESASLL